MLKINLHLLQWRTRFFWQKLALVLMLTAGLIWVGKLIFKSSAAQDSMPNKMVEIEKVKKQSFLQTIRLLGTIHPKHATVLTAKGTGMLDAITPTGQHVKKGTLLAKIDNPEVEKNLQLTVKTEALAKNQYERLTPLMKSGYVSAKEVEEKKQVWLDAQKELSKAKIDLDNLRFYAPFDGIIGAYKKREGAQIDQGEAVVTLYDPSALVVDFDIPCSNLDTVNEKQSAIVSGKKYVVSHMQKMLDEDTHMCPADFDIHCENCLIGSAVNVDLIVSEKEDTIVIPFQAIFLRNSKPYVYLVNKGKVKLTAVKTGLRQQDKIEIIKGLKLGQQLIIKGQERLYPEMAVDIYQPESKSAKNGQL